jgi:hypothetical protein
MYSIGLCNSDMMDCVSTVSKAIHKGHGSTQPARSSVCVNKEKMPIGRSAVFGSFRYSPSLCRRGAEPQHSRRPVHSVAAERDGALCNITFLILKRIMKRCL